MLKLKVEARFQVLTSKQKAQPTRVHLLKLVKIKIHSQLGSCHSQRNYAMDACCLNSRGWSTRLFKDTLGNRIRVSQDLGPNCEAQVGSPSRIQDQHLALSRHIQKRGI